MRGIEIKGFILWDVHSRTDALLYSIHKDLSKEHVIFIGNLCQIGHRHPNLSK